MMLLRQSTHRMVIQYHPRIGFTYVPNLRARIPNETGGYFVQTNSQGFRSDVEFHSRRNGRPRILFFGDSYTAGDGCDNHQRFPERLGEALDVEIFNYGMSGSGTDQQLLIYEEFARAVEADLIVLCVTVENIQRNTVPHRESIDRTTGKRVLVPKPYFTLDQGRLCLHQVPVPLHRAEVDSPGTQRNGHQRSAHWIDWPLQVYRTAPWLKRLRHGMQSRFLDVQSRILRSINFQPYADYASDQTPGWQLMRAIIGRFHSGVSTIPLLIVPIPTYFFYLHGLKPRYQQLFDGLAAPDRGLHVSRLTSGLQDLPDHMRTRLGFKHDTHFSPFGHEQVARLLEAEIAERGLLPKRSPAHGAAVSVRKSNPRRSTYVLGLSCFYHNSAAALIKDGTIVAAAEEERFTRVKNDRGFPHQAANYCLEEGGIHQHDLAAVVYYDNAALTFERIMHTLLAISPQGEETWLRIMPSWSQYKLGIPRLIRRALSYDGVLLHERHHRSHAASAFYPSPFERAALLTIDGVGEWATASIGVAQGHRLHILQEMHFPHSLGLLYSAFTQFTGFKVNEGEYKMMGLAPYGEPTYVDRILKHLVDLKDDGSVELNLEYFGFLSEATMTNARFAELFDGPPRQSDSMITQREMNIARSMQVVTEEAVLRMARHAHRLTGEKNLCMAGGVALNCVANGRLLREGPFENIWIQPAAGDSGGALGAALDAYHNYFSSGQTSSEGTPDKPRGTYWGPAYSDEEIQGFLNTHGYRYQPLSASTRADTIAALLESGKVVGHFAGRMEFGPRSLGARSILGDARNREMQVTLNLKIKYRESFRPFAPTVLADKANDHFDLKGESPYMLIVAPVRRDRRKPFHRDSRNHDLLSIVRQERSDLPAITHIDYSARIQTLTPEDHPLYYDLIKSFHGRTGYAVVVNTSFNVRGEPIVCTPYDAYRCFMRTDMDALVLGHALLLKHDQPAWPETKGHMPERDGSIRPQFASGFLKGLRRIYRQQFLPAAALLQAAALIRVATRLEGRSTTWQDVPSDLSPKDLFTVAEVMDSENPDPERLARAITDEWSPGRATEDLRPVLVSLLTLGRQYPRPEALEEDVSDSVYVMF